LALLPSRIIVTIRVPLHFAKGEFEMRSTQSARNDGNERLILGGGGDIVLGQSRQKSLQFMFTWQMQRKPFDAVAILPEPGAITALRGECKMFAPNQLRQICICVFSTTLLLASVRISLSASVAPWCLYVSNCLAPLAAATNEIVAVDGQERQVGSVKMADIDANFVQSDASCVLANYAIVANYFTRLPVRSYFEGYCHHFGIVYTNAVDAERKYSRHFDAEWQKRKCSGYEVILDLHSTATEECFVQARSHFDARIYPECTKHLNELRQVLETREAFLNITFRVLDDTHSVTTFYDGPSLMVRDTAGFGIGIYPVVGQADTNRLIDCVLYTRK
jgi:hypothetical protein